MQHYSQLYITRGGFFAHFTEKRMSGVGMEDMFDRND